MSSCKAPALLLLALLALPVCGQFDTATVLGTISDPSGSVIPGCGVRLTGVDTGVVFSTTTDAEGNFQFFNVRIGRYTVTAESTGFKTAVSAPFTVVVAARQRVDLTLEVGDTAESITVSEAATLLETDTSSRSTVIGSRQAVALPLNGRAYADLTLLTPGTAPALRGLRDGRDASYHVNGLRSSYNNFTLDGVENNAYGTSNQGFSNQVVQLSPDAVGEFKVTTNNFSAEYGRAGGAVITATLRSGTNQFHLTAWEFLRNKKLNATGFFKPRTGEKPNLIQNQFGIAAGGPLIRNKTFYFADYEGFRRVQSELIFTDLPTMEMRQGIFNVAVADPYTGTPYGGNQVPLSFQTPFARRVLNDLPAPNRPGTGALGIGNSFESLPGERFPDNKGNAKIDHYWNERTTSFFRYSHRELNQFSPPAIPGPSGGNSNGNVRVFNQAVTGGVTYTVNPGSLLEFRLAVTRTEGGKTPVNAGEPHIEQTYGIRGIPDDPRIGGGLNTQTVSGINTFGRQDSNPQFQYPTVWNPRVNYSTIQGRHTFKFGYEYQRIATEINDLSPVYGRSEYNGRFSTPAGVTGNNLHNLADFLVGAQSLLEKSTFEVLQYRQRMHFLYIQDDWKFSPKLTLNLGLRYEFATPQWEANNKLGNFDPATASLIVAKDGSIQDRSTIRPDWNNWGPRIGFAYSVTRKTVVRSGYGISYIHFNRMGGENILGFTGPFYFRVTRNQVAPGVPRGGEPLCQPGQEFTTCFTRTQDGFPANFNDPSRYDTRRSRVNYIPSDTPTGYVQSWHFTIQRELARDLVLDVGYVGNRGVNQLILGDFNQARPNQPGENTPLQQRRPFQNYEFIQIAFGGGNTFYHGLQTKVEKKFSSGFYMINSFTWSKAIDNAAGHLETYNGDNSRVNFYDLPSERGLSSYDIPFNNVTAIIWDVPFGRNRRFGADWGAAPNAVLGGWQVSFINNARSGNPINLTYGPTAQFQVCSSCTPRPNVLGPVENPSKDINSYFNIANVVVPTDPTRPFGNAGRNIARSHSFHSLDFGLFKEFALPREGSRIEFRSEFFNLFNHTNFLAAASRRDASNFGTITGTFPARQIQFALKFYY